MMSARHPYGKTKFDFMCLALPVMAGNSYPSCLDISEGMVRRLNVFPFDRKFTKEEANPKIFEYIWENEMPGVFNLSLEGFKRVLKRGSFEPPEDCLIASSKFLAHSNPLWCFIQDCLVQDPEGRIMIKHFRGYFDDWTKDQGYPKKPVLDKTLKRKLEGLGFSIAWNGGNHAIQGWRYAPPNIKEEII